MAEKQQANLWRLCYCRSAFSRCLACLHTCLFLTARWPKFDLSFSQRTPLTCFPFFFFFYSQLYICSPGPESFFLSSSLPEIEITRKKLSEGWVNFENQLWKSVSWRWNLFSSARNRILQISDGPKLMVHMPSKKQREWSTKRVVAESKKDEKMLFLDPKGNWHSV